MTTATLGLRATTLLSSVWAAVCHAVAAATVTDHVVMTACCVSATVSTLIRASVWRSGLVRCVVAFMVLGTGVVVVAFMVLCLCEGDLKIIRARDHCCLDFRVLVAPGPHLVVL